MDKLGIGLVGCGVMGSDLARGLVKVPRARLVAVCDAAEEAAKKLATELSIPDETDHRRLFDRKDVDAVIIASPCFLHRPMVEDAARAGKQIYCEKPLGLNVADCDTMIAAAKKARVKLMVGHVLRYHPQQRKVKELVASGELGAPTCMSVHRLAAAGRAFGRNTGAINASNAVACCWR